jgi:transcriptional regulator with AAA-type ATPase domain
MDSVTAAAAGVAGLSGAPYSRSAPLLIGRTLEQLFLREELAAAYAGRGRLVLLGGEAGIGKTILARDLANEAVPRDRFPHGSGVSETVDWELPD